MEKKRLMEHWNSSLAGMKQRDEAYVVTQGLLRYGLKADLRTPQIWAGGILEGDSSVSSGVWHCGQGVSGRTSSLL